jgi:GT2 family glycosyltransferase
MPRFSCIIPVKPGGPVAALEALRAVDGRKYPFEVLVAEGRSPSRQRNQAARQAAGDVLLFLDDDSRVAADCLRQCVAALEDPAVAVVGGPSLTPGSDSALQRLFGEALTSVFGAGAMRNRYRSTGLARETTEQELILCNLAFRRDLFLRLGGFDERLYPNEENELLDRISAQGYRLLHLPAMAVQRSQRHTLAAFMRQMFAYGRGRAQQSRIAGLRSWISLVPLAFVLYLLLLPLLLIAGGQGVWLPLFSYLALDLGFTLIALGQSGRIGTLLLALVFPLMHCCNGIGLLYGFLARKPQPALAGQVTISRLKSFEQAHW